MKEKKKKTTKNLTTPEKNKKDEGFIKIPYLNQENKNTHFDYKQISI